MNHGRNHQYFFIETFDWPVLHASNFYVQAYIVIFKMPKVKRTAKIRSKLTANTSPAPISENVDEKDASTDQVLSRGQKKRQAKRDQYLKREKMIFSSLHIKRMEEQKGRLDGLDALKEALTKSMKANSQNAEGHLNDPERKVVTKTNKSKKSLAQAELPHLNLVLQHPAFKSNPFAAMQEHLCNSLAKQAEEQAIVAKEKREEESKKASEKKEERKERIRNAKYEKGRKHRRRRR